MLQAEIPRRRRGRGIGVVDRGAGSQRHRLGHLQMLTGIVVEGLGILSEMLRLGGVIEERHVGDIDVVAAVRHAGEHIHAGEGRHGVPCALAHDLCQIYHQRGPCIRIPDRQTDGVGSFIPIVIVAPAVVLQPEVDPLIAVTAVGTVDQHHVAGRLLRHLRSLRRCAGDPDEAVEHLISIGPRAGIGNMDMLGGNEPLRRHHAYGIVRRGRFVGRPCIRIGAGSCRGRKIGAQRGEGHHAAAAILPAHHRCAGTIGTAVGRLEEHTVVEIVIDLDGPVDGALLILRFRVEADILQRNDIALGSQHPQRKHLDHHHDHQQQRDRSSGKTIFLHTFALLPTEHRHAILRRYYGLLYILSPSPRPVNLFLFRITKKSNKKTAHLYENLSCFFRTIHI